MRRYEVPTVHRCVNEGDRMKTSSVTVGQWSKHVDHARRRLGVVVFTDPKALRAMALKLIEAADEWEAE